MDITERVIGSAIVLDVRGSLYGLDAGCRLERTVERLGRSGRPTIVANLEQVQAIDAGGLGALVAAYNAAARNRVTFRIIRASRRIRHLIVATRLARVLRTFGSLEDALDEEHEPAASSARAARSRWRHTLQRGSSAYS